MVDVLELPRPRWCYLEIPARDVHASADFYAAVFGWQIRRRETGRPSFDDAAGVVSGAFVAGREPAGEARLLPYIWVDDLAATLTAVVTHGGVVVQGQHRDREPDGEWIATFHDPGGNLIGLYQESAH